MLINLNDHRAIFRDEQTYAEFVRFFKATIGDNQRVLLIDNTAASSVVSRRATSGELSHFFADQNAPKTNTTIL